MNVSVIIPALNEEQTVATVVRACLADNPVEVLVIDADSTDATAIRAREAGARVVNWREVMPGVTPRPGKGESLWRGVAAARGDVVCFIDADLTSATPGMVNALSAPFAEPRVQLVKATYPRTLSGKPTGGGRVTELSAKPLIREFFPHLMFIDQPLGGEYALRRSAARQLPFVDGYGVDIALLIDCAETFGVDSLAQVGLPARVHRNRPLHQLAPMAHTVARTILWRAGVLRTKPGAHREPLDRVG
ncbi:glucosyl-3-phosphoglycerate synthase [Corynebacterium phocae]|uniref:Glucosyl-3-phosphoglycerate synthase n=1 Tax=Corynebacterium phocae TaxID=161895 RepID=A0A1L7D3Y5_9CORY|nr:glucosyl-3-phosphoglycerate synthase [Corynebacterium phocae]APT92815.1 glucosyl-3-phosphoglycerate synthase [Corynebacterium phocae]KAA8723133.1 glucosyl-3-phosphoglycerate synthase [Corynebacterium phocae]